MRTFLFIILTSAAVMETAAQQPVAILHSEGTPNGARQTQGMNFGEKVAGGLQSGANAMTVSDSGKGGLIRSGAVSSSYAAGRLSMTPTTPRQTQGSGFGEKAGAGNPLYASGVPIGGIVVKGGKSSAGSMPAVVSDPNGVFELNNLEAGTYQFMLTIPDAPQEKSINEKGVKRQEAAGIEKRTYTGGRKNDPQEKSISGQRIKGNEAQDMELARPGTPIGGIVVKGGKNPGGGITILTVNKNGEIQFEVLKAGNYKFIIQSSDDTQPGKASEKKEQLPAKATSGLKDTLKTNV